MSDKVSNKGVFRLIVNVLRCANLLDIALIHNNDGVRHGKSLLLVVCDVDEGDTELVFEADELILHALAQL